MIRVAIVDPHQIVRDGLQAIIESDGGLVVDGSFGDAVTAVESLNMSPPDVVITAADLPDCTGAEFITRIKRDWPDVRVVTLTGSHADAELLLALEAGTDGFVYKEEPGKRVVLAIHEVLQGNAYVSPLAARRMRDLALAEDRGALSPRELEVLVSMHDGLTTAEIAGRLCVSESTVKTHLGGIYRKLDAHNRVSASREAERRGILPSD